MAFAARLDQVVTSFIQQVSKTYKLPYLDLLRLWKGEAPVPPVTPLPMALPTVPEATPSASAPSDELYDLLGAHFTSVVTSAAEAKAATDAAKPSIPRTSTELMGCTGPVLASYCKMLGVPCTGTKPVLTKRILESLGEAVGDIPLKTPAAKPVPKTVKPLAHPVMPGGVTAPAAPTPGKITVTERKPAVFRPNAHGLLEHVDLPGLIYNKDSKKIYARQQPDGDLVPLTEQDIDDCMREGLAYETPEDLDAGAPPEEIDELKGVLLAVASGTQPPSSSTIQSAGNAELAAALAIIDDDEEGDEEEGEAVDF